MRLTSRQDARIRQIIEEEVARGLQARRDGQLLNEAADANQLALADPQAIREGIEGQLVSTLQHGIDALVQEFTKANRWSRGVEHATGADKHGWEEAVRVAANELRAVVDRGVREVEEALMDGMYVSVGD